jgi:VWFA-related protein
MQLFRRASNSLFLLLLSCLTLAPPVRAQKNHPPRETEQSDDVVRINTELVQSDVMVFDRQGRFVDNLRPEEFELSLEGKKQTLSFFERVTAGSQREAAQLAAARMGSTTKSEKESVTSSVASDTGRIIFFFLDDVHLSSSSLVKARKALQRFVDYQMNPNDQVAIVSSSGQIGFLQQLTDNQIVLRAAVARLDYKQILEPNLGKTRITEYMASRIEDARDRQLFHYLMESVKLEYGMGLGSLRGDHKNASGSQAMNLLQSQLRLVNAQSKSNTAQTLFVLQSLMQSTATLPGRKLVFFLSDGFTVDPRGSNALAILHKISEAAARTGAIVYTMDTRENFSDPSIDASRNDYADLSSRRAGLLLGEVTTPREPLRVLAEETGGRAIFNSDSIEDEIQQAIRETSAYYVLAWRPDSENERYAKTRLQVTIKGRPELRVRMRRNYYVPTDAPKIAADKTNSTPATSTRLTPEAELLTALGSTHPQKNLPTSLSVGYVNTSEQGLLLKASMQIRREAFSFNITDASQKAEVDVIGAAIDDRGLIYTFKQILTVTPDASKQSAQIPIIWHQQLKIRPGLYQVRVAVRERATARAGSAMQWIEVPEVAPERFAMSSLFLGERRAEESVGANVDAGAQPLMVDVDHHFARTSVLRFQTFIYHAALGAGAPDVWIHAEVFRGRKLLVSLSPGKVPTGNLKDFSRLPYWTELALHQLPAGRYTLKVTATDRSENRRASQQINFTIE